MANTIAKDDLLFHPAHGLCRVAKAERSVADQELNYTLKPVSRNQGKISFLIPESAFEESGFNKLLSVKEGQSILEYFKSGKKAGPDDIQAWEFAKLIWSESGSTDTVRDARKRQRLSRAVNGLVDELALVLEMTLAEIAGIIQKNLEKTMQVNPMVQTAIGHLYKRDSDDI